MAIACFAGISRVPHVSKNDTFEALGGQVGQEHVIAAHLDGEGTTCSAPNEPQEDARENIFFCIACWIVYEAYF